MEEIVQPVGMWGLPWGLLCGTSGRKDLRMVPCHSCHIYGVGDAWKSSFGGGDASHKRGALFIGKVGSHFVILLYCETLWQVLLGIYCKRFYWIPLFTILLLFYMLEVGKAKSATQKCPNDINTEWAIPEKFLSFLLYPWKLHILNPHPFPLCLFLFIIVLVL